MHVRSCKNYSGALNTCMWRSCSFFQTRNSNLKTQTRSLNLTRKLASTLLAQRHKQYFFFQIEADVKNLFTAVIYSFSL